MASTIKFRSPHPQLKIAQYAAKWCGCTSPFQNETTKDLWTIDDNNNWAILFSEGNTRIEVKHRYSDKSAVEAATRRLAVKFGIFFNCQLEEMPDLEPPAIPTTGPGTGAAA